MKTLHLSPTSASSPSFALISVLALVSLAALTATAFLASARLERQATMPLTQTTQLEMALNAGANAAKEMLDYAPSKHFNFVTTYWRGAGTNDWTNELGYLLNGAVRSTNQQTSTIVNYYCCFSTATMTNLGTTASATIVVSNDITSQGTFLSQMTTFMNTQTNFANGQSTNIPLLGDTPTNRCTSPPVGWVYINQDVRLKPGSTNTTNVPVTRFAFYVQDQCSMIDAERMGGLTNGTPYRDSTALPTGYNLGTNPAEISLTNLTGTVLTNSANASNFTSTNNRVKYLSPGMLVLSNGGGGLNTNDLRYITTGLRQWTNAYERIPIGLGYANSWSNKCNLSINANLKVATIASVITTNLTQLTNRAGGLCLSVGGGAKNAAAYTGTAYIQTLAANIIDYIDTDSDPTTDGTAISTNLIRPVYRGVDSYPFVNEINKRYVLISTNAATINGTKGIAFTVSTTDSLELWNLSSQTSPAGTLQFVAVHGQPGTLGFQPINFNNPTGASNSSGAVLGGCTTNNLTVGAISPNCFATFACATVTNLFFYPSTNPAIFSLTQEYTNSRYFVAWNGVYCDAALGGLRRNSGNLTLGTPANRANLPSFIYATPTGAFTNPAVGDPRATIYLSQVQDFNAYVGNATFGGRNVRAGTVAANKEYYEVTPNNWPDGGHSSPKGASPTSDNQIPTSFSPINTNLPPGRISNKGSLSNIYELGGVFDPIQWGDPSLGVWQGKWTNLSMSGVSNNTYGGGTSLRIGRAEHPPFSWTNLTGATVATPNMMMASAALLDLFCTTNQFDESGQINLNTASAPVLRALGGRIYLRSDPALLSNSTTVGTNYSTPPAMVEAFAQGVMRFRAKYPFYSPSQLSFIGTATNWPNTNNWPTNAVFGNTNSIYLANAPGNTFGTSTSMSITEWNDQAAEEWFSKVLKLSTTYSRNFRVYVIAQRATNQGGTNIGVGPVVRKYYNVITAQKRDAETDVPPASSSTFNMFESSY